MTTRYVLCGAALLLACGGDPGLPDDQTPDAPRPAFEPPVLTNAGVPVDYPPALYDEGIDGTVVLRLFVDETGTILPESTVVAEGSGYPQLDSAAIAGVAAMQFAPARRAGTPIATAFLQPVHFRSSDAASGGEGNP
jgi:protein TonB